MVCFYKILTIAVVKHIAIGAEDLGFDSRDVQVGRTVTNGSPPLRCFFGAVLPRCQAVGMGPATRYTLRRNTASIMMMCFFDSKNFKLLKIVGSLLSKLFFGHNADCLRRRYLDIFQ